MQFVRSTEFVIIIAGCSTINRRSKRRWYCRVRVLERAERLGLISELELQVRLTALTAFAKVRGIGCLGPSTVLLL